MPRFSSLRQKKKKKKKKAGHGEGSREDTVVSRPPEAGWKQTSWERVWSHPHTRAQHRFTYAVHTLAQYRITGSTPPYATVEPHHIRRPYASSVPPHTRAPYASSVPPRMRKARLHTLAPYRITPYHTPHTRAPFGITWLDTAGEYRVVYGQQRSIRQHTDSRTAPHAWIRQRGTASDIPTR
eukprot:3241163-Rhodomonas_salina.1